MGPAKIKTTLKPIYSPSVFMKFHQRASGARGLMQFIFNKDLL